MGRKVTELFKIPHPVPFVDVNIDSDNELFVDPSAIRNGNDKYARRAHTQLVSCFTEVLTCARSKDRATQAHGLWLLQQMHEPNETRLGYSARDPRGHGFGNALGARLWDAIVENPTLDVGVDGRLSMESAILSRLERVPLFVKGVDRDLISDLATRIIFDVLHDFTSDMVGKYSRLGASSATSTYPVWDVHRGTLSSTRLTLPTVDGKPLLLVPKAWVYWRPVMDPDAFYNRYSTQVIQDEQTTYSGDGKVSRPTKKSIKSRHKDKKGTNVSQATKYVVERGRNLAAEYEAELDATFTPLTDEEIDGRIH